MNQINKIITERINLTDNETRCNKTADSFGKLCNCRRPKRIWDDSDKSPGSLKRKRKFSVYEKYLKHVDIDERNVIFKSGNLKNTEWC